MKILLVLAILPIALPAQIAVDKTTYAPNYPAKAPAALAVDKDSGRLLVDAGSGGGGGSADSTAANQVTGNNSLASIDSKVSTGNSSLASLDSKASTGNSSLASLDSKATTGNSSLASIDSKLPAKGSAASSASTPVVLSDDASVSGGALASPVINTELLTNTVSGWYDAKGSHSVALQIVTGAGISAGVITFEQTNDTTVSSAGNVLNVVDATTLNANPVTTLTLAASTSRMFYAPVMSRYVRVRVSTAVTGGSVTAVGTFSQLPYSTLALYAQQATAGNFNVTASLAAAQTLATLTGGATAEDSATSSNPHVVGGIARTALPASTVVAGDAVRQTYSVSGQEIVKQFAPRDLDFNVATTITTATQTAIRAAQAAGIRQNVTSITYQNTNATATTVTIQDGSTTLIQFSAPASMVNPVQLVFPTPLFGTAATALNYTAGTTGASVLLQVCGFNSY